MLGTFKKFFAAASLMAVSVISLSANADIARIPRDHGHGNGYGERWICSTQSRGYVFRAEGYSQGEARYSVEQMCLNHPYGTYSECLYNTQCRNSGAGYPQPGPQRLYTCQTFGGGRWYAGRSPSLVQAKRRAVQQCRSNPWSRPYECESNLQCGY